MIYFLNIIYNILHCYIINVYYNNTLHIIILYIFKFIILLILTFCSSDGFCFLMYLNTFFTGLLSRQVQLLLYCARFIKQ